MMRLALSSKKTGGAFRALAFVVAATQFAFHGMGQSVMGSGYTAPLPAPVARGQLLTIYVQGIAAGITGQVQAQSLPLPTSLAGISVSIQQSVGTPHMLPAPILAVFPVGSCQDSSESCGHFIGINLQIPYELTPNAVLTTGVSLNSVKLTVSENGAAVATVGLSASSDQIHILRFGDTLTRSSPAPAGAASSEPVVTHADGSLVTFQNPAKPGETVVVYAVGIGIGLGRTEDIRASKRPTGNAPSADLPAPGLAVGFDFRPNASPSESFYSPSQIFGYYSGPVANTWAVAGNVGLYQINAALPQFPSTVLPCGQGGVQTNLTIDLNGISSYDGAAICVAVSSQ